MIDAKDFSLEKHRIIYRRMGEIIEAGGKIDRITVANELMRYGELEACDGLSYLVSLDDNLPKTDNIDPYCRIIKDKSVLRQTIFIAQQTINDAMAQEDSPQKILGKASSGLIKLDISADPSGWASSPLEIMESHPRGVTGFLQQAVEPGISTGFPQIDDAILGLQPGCQYVIGGATGMGKSALAVNMGVSIAKRGIPVGMSALEMSKEQILARILCAEAEVPLKQFLKNQLMADQRHKIMQANSVISELPFYIDDTPSVSPGELLGRVARMHAKHNIRVWILDYLQLVDWQSGRDGLKLDTEYSAVSYASRACTLIARRFGISNLILSQLSRKNTKTGDLRPKLSDLRASGQIEQDSTAAILVFREEVYKPGRPELREKAEAIIAKARMGEVGTKILRFRGMCTKFIDEGEQQHTSVDDD